VLVEKSKGYIDWLNSMLEGSANEKLVRRSSIDKKTKERTTLRRGSNERDEIKRRTGRTG
jgi:hypothetical protein